MVSLPLHHTLSVSDDCRQHRALLTTGLRVSNPDQWDPGTCLKSQDDPTESGMVGRYAHESLVGKRMFEDVLQCVDMGLSKGA